MLFSVISTRKEGKSLSQINVSGKQLIFFITCLFLARLGGLGLLSWADAAPVVADSSWYHPNGVEFSLKSAAELAGLAEIVNSGVSLRDKTIILAADIDLSPFATGSGWQAIGSQQNPFAGIFDAAGHTITGLVIQQGISSSDARYLGLFGYVSGGSIQNLTLVEPQLSGYSQVAPLVGYMSSGVVHNCFAWDIYLLAGSGSGGLVGSLASSSLGSCGVSGYISGSGDIGGLVGSLSGGATIANSYSLAEVDGGTGGENIGGLVGVISGSATQVTACYATGEVRGYNRVGGIVGGISGVAATISHSAALSPSVQVVVNGPYAYAGRVVGYKATAAVLEDNIAFQGMNGFPVVDDPGGRDGATRSLEELQQSSAFPDPLVTSPWLYQEKRLPGLEGTTREMPPHLRLDEDPTEPPTAPPTAEPTAPPTQPPTAPLTQPPTESPSPICVRVSDPDLP